MILSRLIWAGTGRMVSDTPNYLNLNLYYCDPAPTDLSIMKNAFQEASRLLFNSTNGQIYISTVRVSKNSAFQSKADVWANNAAGDAYSPYEALGTPGGHITLFVERHRYTNKDGPGRNEKGQFGIVHELGHYAFNLYDEYALDLNTGGPNTNVYCVSPSSDVACIMDGGTTTPIKQDRTEWCTPAGGGLTTDHASNRIDTLPNSLGHSCWEEIMKHCNNYQITLTIPTQVQRTDPSGLRNIAWIPLGDHLRFVLALDRSYSMSVDNKEALAKQAASLFVDLCKVDVKEAIGVVSFSDTAVSDYPMHDVTTTPFIKSDAINAINAIRLENRTALGDGLRRSLNEITGWGTISPDASVVEAIVLLSDGVNNFGTETPANVLPDLRARGVQVFTIGLGNPVHPIYPLDETTLLDISNQTGASYAHVLNADQLSTIYTNYAADIRGMGSYPEATEALEQGTSREHSVLVDRFTNEETFVLHWPYGPNAFKLRLQRPDGTIIGPRTAGVEYVEKNHYIFYRIKKPNPGTWKMIVTAKREVGTAQRRISYTAQAIAQAPGLSCRVSPRRAFYKSGEAVNIRAFVYAGGIPVTDADVSGVVRKPEGKLVKVRLYDDGKWEENGDEKAKDGVYSVRFNDTGSLGTYQVELTINNKEGITATPDELNPDWKSSLIAPFIRASKSSFSVGRQEVKAPKTEK